MVPSAHQNPHPKWHLNWFSHFCTAHDRVRPTDRQCYSICNNSPHLHSSEMRLNNTLCNIVVADGTNHHHHHHTTTVLRPFFRDHPGELVPEENFWTLWCKGRLTEADSDHPARRHSIRINQYPPPPSPIFYGLDALPAAQPTVSKHWRHKPVTQNQSNLLSPPTSVYELFENLSSHQFFVLACIWWWEGGKFNRRVR